MRTPMGPKVNRESVERPFVPNDHQHTVVDEDDGVFVYRRETLPLYFEKISSEDGSFLP
jgi:hypothetical protein